MSATRTVYLWGGPMHHEVREVEGSSMTLSYVKPAEPASMAWLLGGSVKDNEPIATVVRDYAIRRFASPATGQEWWVGTPDGYPLDRISQHLNGAVALFHLLGWISYSGPD